MRTSIVIVNWNGAEFLEPLLESATASGCSDIIVVDNASSDNSLAILSRFPAIRVLHNQSNLGYGNAANQGIEAARGNYVFLLNVDTKLLPGCVDKLEAFTDSHDDAGVVAPQLLYPDGRLQPSCRKFPTVLNLFFYLSYLDRFIPTGYRLSDSDHHRCRSVEQPMGAALLFRIATLKETGLFDREFFLYMEEVDLCKRIQAAGWKIYYLPEAQVIHHAGGSSGQDWERSQRNFFSSLFRYFRKHKASAVGMIMLKCSLSAALLIRACFLLFAGRGAQSSFYATMSLRIWSSSPSIH